jgi:hypothetical protein
MKKTAKMKTLDDIKLDMSVLYEEVSDGTVELKTAGELANIAGKFLKAEQLQLAREIFTSGKLPRANDAQAQLLASNA